MAGITEITLQQKLDEALRSAVTEAVEKAADEAAEKVREAVRKRIGSIAAGLTSEYDLMRDGRTIVIRVKIDD
jgi:2',3'-cyclic-nucleotide 2'-phosphodiesterase (5'-nucleotidase family)